MMRISSIFRAIGQRYRFFRATTEGSMSVEAMLVLPLLVWWYVASFEFFEAFRERNANTKAAYTLADMITRESLPVNAAYIDGMGQVFEYLTLSDEPTRIRVTSITFKQTVGQPDPTVGKFEVQWSHGTGTYTDHTTATLQLVKGHLPKMTPGDTAILVETYSSYVPIFRIGLDMQNNPDPLGNLWFSQFVVMRPRFLPAITWVVGPRPTS